MKNSKWVKLGTIQHLVKVQNRNFTSNTLNKLMITNPDLKFSNKRIKRFNNNLSKNTYRSFFKARRFLGEYIEKGGNVDV